MSTDPFGAHNTGGSLYSEQYADPQTTWFSDPSMQNYDYGHQQVQQSMPQYAQPMAIPTSRPITSVGFEAPPPPELAGTLGGTLGSGGKPTNHSRFGISTYEGEPPLYVELGIDFSKIAEKTQHALHPLREIDPALMADGDLAGPFLFCFSLGFLLMLTGKLHFGYIFGFAAMGCNAMYMILNLMTQKESGIELHVVVSVLGYSLIPIVFLAATAIFLPLRGILGWILVPPCVALCTLTATKFLEATLSAKEQRYLIAYPAFLFFACFALITVF